MLPDDPADAPRLAAAAASIFGLDDVVVVRVGMTTALRAVQGDNLVFVRLHQRGVDASAANRTAVRARDSGVRVPRLLAGPCQVEDRQAWVWEHLTDAVDRISAEDIAEQLARLHMYVAPEGDTRAVVDHRVGVILSRLEAYEQRGSLSAETCRVLADATRQAAQQAATSICSPLVTCHGDLKPTNIMSTPQGAYLVDWDSATAAEAAWDVACWHAACAVSGANDDADRFVDAYEYAMGARIDRGRLHALGELKKLSVTTFIAGLSTEAARSETKLRISHWTERADARGWTDL